MYIGRFQMLVLFYGKESQFVETPTNNKSEIIFVDRKHLSLTYKTQYRVSLYDIPSCLKYNDFSAHS